MSNELTMKLKKYAALKLAEKNAKKQADDLKDEIAVYGKGKDFDHDGFRVEKITRNGSVNYRKVLENHLILSALDTALVEEVKVECTGVGSTYWQIKEAK